MPSAPPRIAAYCWGYNHWAWGAPPVACCHFRSDRSPGSNHFGHRNFLEDAYTRCEFWRHTCLSSLQTTAWRVVVHVGHRHQQGAAFFVRSFVICLLEMEAKKRRHGCARSLELCVDASVRVINMLPAEVGLVVKEPQTEVGVDSDYSIISDYYQFCRATTDRLSALLVWGCESRQSHVCFCQSPHLQRTCCVVVSLGAAVRAVRACARWRVQSLNASDCGRHHQKKPSPTKRPRLACITPKDAL